MKEYACKRLVRDGDLLAEVEIMLRDDHETWGPTMSKEEAFKMGDVRDAMRRKDYKTVAKLARLYRLTPVEQQDLPGTDAA